ncbi:MAG TPA: dienelactone hydrolase family protein [bacterium]|nr:dienelactone hydrolase family protein [bacterium]
MDGISNRRDRPAAALTHLGQYVLEEWAEEYHHGHLSRREFLRRIGVFSGGAALAGTVLAAVGVQASPEELAAAAASPAPARLVAQAPMVPPDDPAVRAQLISYPSGSASVIGYLVQPVGKSVAPGVVITHENRGLLDHHMDVARRVAKAGYVALAPDLASPIGGTAKYQDLAQVTAFLGQTPPAQLVAMLDAGVRHLQRLAAVRRDRVGAMGFCFGGGLTWQLAMQNGDLKAVVPFYGPNPPSLDGVAHIRAAVLAFYGALDERVDAGIPAMRAALGQAHVTYEIVVEPNAGHAFFNDTGPAYNAAAATDAWPKTIAWFAKYLGS